MLVATTAPQGIAGDVNADGYVNVGDLQAVIAAWGTTDNGTYWNWNPDADLNVDGQVNVSDLQMLATHWGQHH